MRILVVGANGYLGSHVTLSLVAAGHEVIGLEQSSSTLDRLSGLGGAVEVFFSDKIDLGAFFATRGIAGVIHAATYYGRDKTDSGALVRANVEAPVTILSQALPHVGFFINCDTVLLPETSPYALSKFQFR